MRLRFAFAICLLILGFTSRPLFAQQGDKAPALARSIFQQLIEINTTDSAGSTTAAAEAMATRLRDAGFSTSDAQVLRPADPRKGNLVARLHGTGARRPILLIGHLDVVEAKREDWSVDPFHFLEKDGYFYGRGTQDMKDGDTALLTSLIRFKQEGYKPDRDIILALTADEEGGKSNGVDWLLRNHRDLIDAEYVLNPDAGGVTLKNGKPIVVTVEASEKLYADFQLEVKNPGGHSSLPVPDNAIYHLADALQRLQNYEFPFELNDVTRSYFRAAAATQSGQTAKDMFAILKNPPDRAAIARLNADPLDHANMHTTCVATRLDAGHANNALPQTARAIVNCRILPGHTKAEIQRKLVEVLNDPQVLVRYVADNGDVFDSPPAESLPSPVKLRPDVIAALTKVANEMWPGAPVIPVMETGASDGVFTNAAGMPTYGISGFAIEQDDVRAHGKDERLSVKSFYDGIDFYYRLLKVLTSQQ